MTSFQKVIKYCALGLAILLIVSIAGGVLRLAAALGAFRSGSSEEPVENRWSGSTAFTDLELELRSLELEIKEGEGFSLESNSPHITVKEQGSTLIVREKKNNFKNGKLTLCIPKDHSFRKVEIDAGAGEFLIQSLSAEVLDLDLGAGEAIIENLAVTKRAEIDGGAGKLTVCNGAIRDLDVDMGVGQLSVTARLTGTSMVDCGVGKTVLNLIGIREDYQLHLDKGIGTATFNGEPMRDQVVYGDSNCVVNIDSGIGPIEIYTIEE